jgi:hypothetical protein
LPVSDFSAESELDYTAFQSGPSRYISYRHDSVPGIQKYTAFDIAMFALFFGLFTVLDAVRGLRRCAVWIILMIADECLLDRGCHRSCGREDRRAECRAEYSSLSTAFGL